MTTIAYRNGVLAADRREVVEHGGGFSFVLTDNDTKVRRLPDGSLFAGCGSSDQIERVRARLEENIVHGTSRKMPKTSNCECVWVQTDGSVWYYSGRKFSVLDEKTYPYFAIGSGAAFALAAMDAGADAVEAVRIASKRDVWTGGDVQSLVL